jgi:L-fucose isomerase-like protein
MYESLNCFEEALKHFGTRVEMISAMEMARKISAEDAYQMIKDELKDVKACRKKFNKKNSCD